MPFVTARAPKRRGRHGGRYRIALRPASWCCIREDKDRLLQGCEPPWRLSEPVVRLSRVYIPGEESVVKGTSGLCVLPARCQSEGVDVHQPNSSALGASSSQRLGAFCGFRRAAPGTVVSRSHRRRPCRYAQDDDRCPGTQAAHRALALCHYRRATGGRHPAPGRLTGPSAERETSCCLRHSRLALGRTAD